MEDLPAEYIEHSLPLVFLTGLPSAASSSVVATGQAQQPENGTRIAAESPECNVDRGNAIQEQLVHWDGSQQPWNAIALPGPSAALKYRFRIVGPSFTLPPRKAAPLPQSPSTEAIPARQAGNELHSPLSPLSPGSAIFPDGTMAPAWFAKHQSQVPCLVLAFFSFAVGVGSGDDTIKTDIINMKAALARSGYRTRFAAVLVSDRSILQSPELEERFQSIRRATALDSKTGIFFMPPMPSAEGNATFMQTMFMALQPQCVEYYRELTKHARRKKARSSVPPSPTLPVHATAQSLSVSGWNARYELKQAVFAECRQEMDVAERHFTQALEDLCNTDGLLESLPNWSPRWNETRLLCDSIATRIIRCHLWNYMTTTATHFWYEYRNRMKTLVDAKGKGTQSYGWLACEARWARIMAQLIQLAELSMHNDTAKSKNEPLIDLTESVAYLRPERAFQGVENLPPHYLMHHPGYWDRLALSITRARYKSALAIPDEDRIPPGQSPASSVASRAQAYDTYLVPEPHEEYQNALDSDVVDTLRFVQITEEADQEFSSKGQRRMTEVLSLDLAQDLIDIGLNSRALDVLLPLWESSTWRQERWHTLFEHLLKLLHQCALATKNAAVALPVMWEIQCLRYLRFPADTLDADDIGNSEVSSDDSAALEFANTEKLSPLSVSFAFDEGNAYASEPIKCQLILRTIAPQLMITKVEIILSNGHQVDIHASKDVVSHSEIYRVSLEQVDDAYEGEAPLQFTERGECILDFATTFQNAGAVSVAQILITIAAGNLHVEHKLDNADLFQATALFTAKDDAIISHETRAEDTTAIEVLPKPPKIEIKLIKAHKQHYAGEMIKARLELVNRESVEVNGTLSLSITTSDGEVVSSYLGTIDREGGSSTINELAALAQHTDDVIIRAPQQVTRLTISVTFTYALNDSRQTMLIKTFQSEVELLPLFEPKWHFGALLHPDPWPSYFNPDFQEDRQHPAGIPHRWRAGFTGSLSPSDGIVVHDKSLRLEKELEDAVCAVEPTENTDANDASDIDHSFSLTTTKIMAEDRRPLQLLLNCELRWSRKDEEEVHIYSLPVPKITLPTAEPRVLCTISQEKSSLADATLQYHLENPSNHFLTFALSMQATDDFAFSGSKYRNLSLAPMSRVCVPFDIMLHDTKDHAEDAARWIYPHLEVVDSYYQKTLRIQPAGSDVTVDSQAGLGVLIRR